MSKNHWFFRQDDPEHVISLCAGHTYLARQGWAGGTGAFNELYLGTAVCCACACSLLDDGMNGAPLKPEDHLPVMLAKYAAPMLDLLRAIHDENGRHFHIDTDLARRLSALTEELEDVRPALNDKAHGIAGGGKQPQTH